MNFGRLVRAMLAPHHAEDAQLSHGGSATQRLQDFLVFRLRQSMLAEQLMRNLDRLLCGRHGEILFSHIAKRILTFAAALPPAGPPPAPGLCAGKRPARVSAEPCRKWL